MIQSSTLTYREETDDGRKRKESGADSMSENVAIRGLLALLHSKASGPSQARPESCLRLDADECPSLGSSEGPTQKKLEESITERRFLTYRIGEARVLTPDALVTERDEINRAKSRDSCDSASASPSLPSLGDDDDSQQEIFDGGKPFELFNKGDLLPSDDDVLIGTGRACSSHAGNRRYQREIFEACDEYHAADYKKRIAQHVIETVLRRGGRFLAKQGGKWVVVEDSDRLERNARKAFHMAKKQKETAVKRKREFVDRQVAAIEFTRSCGKLDTGTRIVLHSGRGLGSLSYFATIEDRLGTHMCRLRYDHTRLPSGWVDLSHCDYQVIEEVAHDHMPPICVKKRRKSQNSWTSDEDEMLRLAVKSYGTEDWARVSAMVPSRVHWQCRQRWIENLDPSIDDKTPLTQEECQQIVQLNAEFGNRWTEITRKLPYRRSTKRVRHTFLCRILPILKKYLAWKHGHSDPEQVQFRYDGRWMYPYDVQEAAHYVANILFPSGE